MSLQDVLNNTEHALDLFTEAPALVQQRFIDMENFAINGFNLAMSSIQQLTKLAGSLQLITQTIPLDPDVIKPPVINETPPTINDQLFIVNYPPQAVPPTLIDATLGPISNNFPTLIGPGDVNVGPLKYVSRFMESLKKWICESVTNGSTGVPDNVQDAMFQKNLERDTLVYQDEQDKLAGNWGRGSFPFPNGGLKAVLDRASMDFANKRLDVSRDIMIKAWEISLQNMHFLITQGVAVESLMIKWAGDTAERILKASIAEIDKYIKSYEASVKGFSEQARIVIEKCKAKIEYNIGMIRMYEASVQAYVGGMQAEAERIKAVATGYEAEVSVFNAIVNFDTAVANLDLETIKARIQEYEVNGNILIKNEEVQLKAYEMLNALKEEAEKAIGAIAAQVASGALAAVHAQVHISAGDSASLSSSIIQTQSV